MKIICCENTTIYIARMKFCERWAVLPLFVERLSGEVGLLRYACNVIDEIE